MRLVAFAAALTIPALAAGQTTSAIPATKTASIKKPDPLDKIVCRTEDTLGTRLGAHRVCASVRDWKEQAEQNRQAAELMQGVGVGCSETAQGNACN